ncbi:MAG: hypothetical protein KatS3mg091_551 [Patescibacteria group bacterium]|nr:MAG: hypothetical protein KatS3mg091_551 [Patescibacteria group bacterium]
MIKSDSDIYTDGWQLYDTLTILGYNHKKVKYEDNEFYLKDEKTNINGVKPNWLWIKRRLINFNDMKKDLFKKYLLESE